MGDLALASLLAFYTQDAEQLARILRGSGRERFAREGYATRTVAKALEGRENFYRWPTAMPTDADRKGTPRLKLVPADTIPTEGTRWLWRPRLPLRGLSVVAGEKGLGKSLLTNAWLVANATLGTLPGELEGQPIDMALASAEDGWSGMVVPRLVLCGADLSRVHRVAVPDSILTLPDDVPMLEDEIQRLQAAGRCVGLLVIDPIGAFLSGTTDTHRDALVRRRWRR